MKHRDEEDRVLRRGAEEPQPKQTKREKESTGKLKEYLRQAFDKSNNPTKLHALLESCPYLDDSLDLFLFAMWIGQSHRVPLIGALESSAGNIHVLLEHIATKFKTFTGSDTMPFEVVSSLGSLCPFPLLALNDAVEWLKETDSAEYHELRRGGMLLPGSIFSSRLNRHNYFSVVANFDPMHKFSDADQRTARYAVKALHTTGIPILGVYQDKDSLNMVRNVVADTEVFTLGRF
jgi:hypothetical protein